MADDTLEDIQHQLLKLHGRMSAFAEAIRIIGEESGKVAAEQPAGEEASADERLARAEALTALSLEAVRGSAMRINLLFEQANAEFEEIKTRLAPGRSFSTH